MFEGGIHVCGKDVSFDCLYSPNSPGVRIEQISHTFAIQVYLAFTLVARLRKSFNFGKLIRRIICKYLCVAQSWVTGH